MKTSVLGAINILGMAKRCHAKVLQASTSEVYGDPECTRNRNRTAATSIRSVRVLVTTKASVPPKRSFSTTGG